MQAARVQGRCSGHERLQCGDELRREGAFGGTSSDGSDGGDPLTCVFDLTGNEAAGVLASGSAVQVQLKPNYYATSGMGKGVGQTVDGIGAPAEVLGNTLFVPGGADVIEILTLPYDASSKAQSAAAALGKKFYPGF
ncbi:MAG TPA: hypothetical protein VFC03_15385 [Acidimicrobiales bacterium]|nr:hypothetical protein [Acidimicrobiales bacterium]